MQMFVNSNYNFVKWRFAAVAFSLLIVIIGAVQYMRHGFNMGIDFAGGANVVLKFREEVPMDQLRSEVPHAAMQQYGKPEEHAVLIRLPRQATEGDYAGAVVAKLNKFFNPESASKLDLNFEGREAIATLLASKDPDAKGTNVDAKPYYEGVGASIINRRSELGIFQNMGQVSTAPGVTSGISRVLNESAYVGKFNRLNQETVGPQVGAELQQKAIWAVIFSTLAMGIYLWLRFDIMFGASAVACIIHDVTVALAFLLIINGEFSLNIVAALLLIVGFSINDTVVMYDRVRENKRKLKGKTPLDEQLNVAMNQTLSRTILTSGSVVLVLLALIFFGGKVINEFAWILLIGVLAGTYSTVTIVPAVAIAWDHAFGSKLTERGGNDRGGSDRPRVEPARVATSPERKKAKRG
jgi:preprotein translocase subunit SecF